MLDKQDIVVLQGMFENNNRILVREFRDEMEARIGASENKLIKRMDEGMEKMRVSIVLDFRIH